MSEDLWMIQGEVFKLLVLSDNSQSTYNKNQQKTVASIKHDEESVLKIVADSFFMSVR